MKTLLPLVFVIVFSGCAHQPVPLDLSADLPKRIPPAEAMTTCGELLPLADASFGSVAKALKSTADAFHACERKRKELEEYIKRED